MSWGGCIIFGEICKYFTYPEILDYSGAFWTIFKHYLYTQIRFCIYAQFSPIFCTDVNPDQECQHHAFDILVHSECHWSRIICIYAWISIILWIKLCLTQNFKVTEEKWGGWYPLNPPPPHPPKATPMHGIFLDLGHYPIKIDKLTGSPVVTTPISCTTFGCLNCPLMAASWRNLIFSASVAPGWSCLTATSTAPMGLCHTPMLTTPNWPEPRALVILYQLPFCTLGTINLLNFLRIGLYTGRGIKFNPYV